MLRDFKPDDSFICPVVPRTKDLGPGWAPSMTKYFVGVELRPFLRNGRIWTDKKYGIYLVRANPLPKEILKADTKVAEAYWFMYEWITRYKMDYSDGF